MKFKLMLIIAVSIFCSCNKNKDIIVWKVSFVDTSIIINNGHFMFSSSYIELPSSVSDSTRAIDIFYENNSKSERFIYQSYAYKSLKDFNNTSNKSPIENREFKGKENIYKQLKLNNYETK